MFTRLREDIRRINYFRANPRTDDGTDEYNPKLYIKSDWKFDAAQKAIENAMDSFEHAYKHNRRRYKKRIAPNLTPLQFRAMRALNNHDTIAVIEADKNLGTCVIDRAPGYIQPGISEHLGNERNYKQISSETAVRLQHQLRYRLQLWLGTYMLHKDFSERLKENEVVYLKRALKEYPDKIARFRMSMKVHKNPVKMRPIVTCIATVMNCWSKWLSYWLFKLTPLLPTYVRDTSHIVQELRAIRDLPPNAFVFTADAISMYNNIDTNHAIDVITTWLDELSTHANFPTDFPMKAIKEAMAIIMSNNHFEFGDLNFLQLLGTAMGTSAAVMWATIYYAYHEVKCLLPKYGRFLYKRRLRRFIDDQFGIWICNECSCPASCHHWKEFVQDMNSFGLLRWTTTTPSKRCVFLDLVISIDKKEIKTRTYQKPMNLFLYVPGTSAHPSGMCKGIVFSLLRRYHEQNSNIDDYYYFMKTLYRNLRARAHTSAALKPIFHEAHNRIIAEATTKATDTQAEDEDDERKNIILHLQYHPNDMPRKEVRKLYDRHCKELFERILRVRPPIIAYSRPKNIGDYVTQARLHEGPRHPASKYLGEYKQGLNN